MINENIQSFKKGQFQVFDVVHKWARDYIKYRSCKVALQLKPFDIFVTCGAGVRKSHLLKTIQMNINKLLMRKGRGPDKPRILLLAPTGVVAINIDGTTTHSALRIRAEGKFTPLCDEQVKTYDYR